MKIRQSLIVEERGGCHVSFPIPILVVLIFIFSRQSCLISVMRWIAMRGVCEGRRQVCCS
jgi:hypothetical protein